MQFEWRLSFAFAFALCGMMLVQVMESRAEETAAATDEEKPYKIAEDGTVDWATFSGFRRYNSVCHTCHGPDGVGSSYAPALAASMKSMDYPTFLAVVAEGRKNMTGGKENVMPGFGNNKNVYCYLDDLYIYLRARAVGDLPRGRPPKKADKPQGAKDYEASCMSD